MNNESDTNLVDVIIADHRNVESVFQELETKSLNDSRRKELVDHVITELVRHSVAEEQFMYPAARTSLADGDEIADHEIAEHAEAEKVMKRLEAMGPDDPSFETTLGTLIGDIRHHVKDEEESLLPRMRDNCSPTELAELGHKVLRAKEVAPTRPHPAAPDKPPANLILGPGAGIVDRVRDALSTRKN